MSRARPKERYVDLEKGHEASECCVKGVERMLQ